MRTSVRMLLLVPLLAAGIDVARVTTACGSGAQTCLEAAGHGWLGPLGMVLALLYALGIGALAVRFARVPSLGRAWVLSTSALALATSGQMALARLAGDGASLGGSPLGVLVLCAVAGLLLALLVRLGAHAAELVADLPRAPRLITRLPLVVAIATNEDAPRAAAARRARGRAPPAA